MIDFEERELMKKAKRLGIKVKPTKTRPKLLLGGHDPRHQPKSRSGDPLFHFIAYSWQLEQSSGRPRSFPQFIDLF
jgi:hypothetical protein